MDFLSIIFFLFLILFTSVYYIVKPKYRYLVIFLGSYVFYGFANPIMLLVLALVTLISYIGGLVIERKKNRFCFVVFFLLEILVLSFYKYTSSTKITGLT